jgi:hypothetical protein
MTKKYVIQKLQYGFNQVGEDVYFVPKPGLGLWAHRGSFEN